jgi:hypothetical protein
MDASGMGEGGDDAVWEGLNLNNPNCAKLRDVDEPFTLVGCIHFLDLTILQVVICYQLRRDSTGEDSPAISPLTIATTTVQAPCRNVQEPIVQEESFVEFLEDRL